MQFSLALVAVLATASFMEAGVSAEIGGDPFSLMKIMLHLCAPGGHSDSIAEGFYGCYDQTPAQKEGFSLCMTKAFDNKLDSKVHIDVACHHPLRMATYVKCLKETFADQADELKAAVETINKCQAAVVGAH